MKQSRKSGSSSAGRIDGNILRQTLLNPRLLCGVALLVLAAVICRAVFWRQAEPEPARYALETAGNEIDFDAPEVRVHTAEDGIAVVNTVNPPALAVSTPDTSEPPPTASGAAVAVPARHTADPATIWQGEAAPTSGGFTMPVEMDGGSIGVLTIPGIGLSVRVYESDDEMADMTKGAAHFKSTSAWQGNIGLSAHNVNFNGTAGYFYSLHTLQKGAVIRYETALGVREYAVESVSEIAEADWSMLGRTEDNRVTLITCITGKPALRLCVQAVEAVKEG